MSKTAIGIATVAMIALTGGGNVLAGETTTEVTAPRTVVESTTNTSMTKTSVTIVGTRSSSSQ